jgi:hypothetical protein
MPRFVRLSSDTPLARPGKAAVCRQPPCLEALEDRLAPTGSPLDLTTAGAQGAVGGAIFQQGSTQPAGSGVIHAFVRIHALGNAAQEQGYNTAARPLQYDENSSPTFTRPLLLSDVPLANVNGVNYRVFLLDINQKSAAPLLSLDQLQVFLGNSGGLTGYDPAAHQLAGLTPVYDLKATGDNWVELNARLSHGLGSSDMCLYVPDASFVGTSGDPYVYLYSRFGDHYGTNGGFEQWAVSQVSGPAPSSLSGSVFNTTSATPVPLAGVMVELTGVDFQGNQVTLFAVTNSSGFYYFDSLAAGTYTLSESRPAGLSAGLGSAGSLGGTLGSGQVSGISLGAGLNGTGYNFTNFLAGS